MCSRTLYASEPYMFHNSIHSNPLYASVTNMLQYPIHSITLYASVVSINTECVNQLSWIAGIGTSGDDELRAESTDRRAETWTTAAYPYAQPSSAHLHREDRQRQVPREGKQPSPGAAGRQMRNIHTHITTLLFTGELITSSLKHLARSTWTF